VLPRSRWNLLDPDVLAWAFSGQPHMDFVRNLFELRSIIEPAAARLAAERRDRTDLKMMRDALTAMRQHTLATDEGRAADRDFHRAILQATRNDAIIVLSASIGAAVSWTTVFKQRGQPLPRNAIPDHVRVYDAIAAGDPDAAAEAMRVLVALALDDTANMVG
jgi:DNA-binding FadR family transcriptional regulator